MPNRCVTVEIELHDASGLRLPTSHKIEKYLDYAKRAEQAISEEFGQHGIDHTVVKNPGPAGKGFEPWCNAAGWYTSKRDPQVKFRYPRLGAFEIVLRCPNFAPGCGLPERVEVWSKLKTSHWPNLERLAALLGNMLRKAQEGQNVSDMVKHLVEQNDRRDRSENSRHEARSPGGVRPMYFGLTSPNRSGSYTPVESRRSRGLTGSVRSEPRSPGGRLHFGVNLPPRIAPAPAPAPMLQPEPEDPQPDLAAEVTLTEPPAVCTTPPAQPAAEPSAEETALPADQTALCAEQTALPEDGAALQAEAPPAAAAPPPAQPELQELARRLRGAALHAHHLQPGEIIRKALKGSATLTDALDLEAFKTALYSLGVFSAPFNFNGLFTELAAGEPPVATLEQLLGGLEGTGLWPAPEPAPADQVEPPAPEAAAAQGADAAGAGAEQAAAAEEAAPQGPAPLAPPAPAPAPADGAAAAPPAQPGAPAPEPSPAAPTPAEPPQAVKQDAGAPPQGHAATEPPAGPAPVPRPEPPAPAAAAPPQEEKERVSPKPPAAAPAVADDYASDFEDDEAKAPPAPALAALAAPVPAPPAPAPARPPAPPAGDYEDEGFEEDEEPPPGAPEAPPPRAAAAEPPVGAAGAAAGGGGAVEGEEEEEEDVEEEFDYAEDVDEDVAAPSEAEIDEVDDESIKTAED